MKKIIKKIIGLLGYKLVTNHKTYDMDYEEDFIKEFESLEPYTVTSIERMYALKQSVQYIVDNQIDGDFIECGVWKGGSCMMIANTLLMNDQQNRELWLYDTFDGMTMPTDEDIERETGNKVEDLMKSSKKNTDKY
ncbi:MAG: macrocin O-methyltransferase, partial [Gammaproteobacteria bacterium]|nr:macrocin O-methyltransferase [Gammaproteobacteria bacterium]